MPPSRIKNTAFKPPTRTGTNTGTTKSTTKPNSSSNPKSKSKSKPASKQPRTKPSRDSPPPASASDSTASSTPPAPAPPYNDPDASDALFSNESSGDVSPVPDALEVLATTTQGRKRRAFDTGRHAGDSSGDDEEQEEEPVRKRGRPGRGKGKDKDTVPKSKKTAPVKRKGVIRDEEDSEDSIPDDDDGDEDDEVEPDDARTGPKQHIPAGLLRTLLQHHFKDKEMRVGAEASLLLGKYVETFVREAIARAVYERAEAKKREGGKEARTTTRDGADFVQVEDLEKLAPQLLLDF